MGLFSRDCLAIKAILFGTLLAGGTTAAYADSFLVTYLAAGVQTPAGITSHYETFNSISPGSSSAFTTNFGNSGYTGSYSSGVQWFNADQFGGAGGSGTYAETFGGYTLTINPSVNYFGLWFSALDTGNKLQFYRNSTLLYSFTPQDFIKLVGSCPGGAFCGNPNAAFSKQNASQQYAYLNFYDSGNTFNRIVFSQTGGGGFESDNHAVAVLNGPPGGTIIGSPEPATIGVVLLVLTLVGVFEWRRHHRTFHR